MFSQDMLLKRRRWAVYAVVRCYSANECKNVVNQRLEKTTILWQITGNHLALPRSQFAQLHRHHYNKGEHALREELKQKDKPVGFNLDSCIFLRCILNKGLLRMPRYSKATECFNL